MDKKKLIAIGWHGMPTYAQAIISKLLNYDFNLISISTAYNYAMIDYKNVFLLNKEINQDLRYKWSDLGLNIPKIFFKTGWAHPAFNSLASEVIKNDGIVISLIDNTKKNNFRQFIGKYIFKIFINKKSNLFWVPGLSGVNLLEYFGVRRDKIITGLYTADTNIFGSNLKKDSKKKQIIFVGQLIERKNVHNLIDAFICSGISNLGWNLVLVGNGPLRDSIINKISKHESINLFDYTDPDIISSKMRASKVLILPSEVEHWGVVVHEATLSGCLIITNERTGAAFDLCKNSNSILLKNTLIDTIKNAFVEMSYYDDLKWLEVERVSLESSTYNSIDDWINKFNIIIHDNLI